MSISKTEPVSVISPEEWLSNEPFRMLVESVNDYAIFMLDPKGFIRTWNPGAAKVKQYRADEIIGKHFSIFYPEEDVRAGKCEHELVVAAATGRFEDEDWRIRKNGDRFWANVVISAIRSPDGELRGFAKVTRDLTERRRAEEILRQSELRLRLLVESIRDYAIFMLDVHGNITTWNAGAQSITQYSSEEIVGQHFSRFYTQDAVDSGHPAYELRVAASAGRYEEEGWRVRRDGSHFWANVVISAIRGDNGELLGFAKVTRDLTERKNAERESVARMAAEAASKAKDEFLAILGHELRNPLAPTLTAVQLIKLRGELRDSKEFEIIERQLRHMVRLVDDLLDLASIARRTVDIKKERLDLSEVIARAVEMVSVLIEDRRHELNVKVPPGTILVEGDSVRLAQVFANLLTNAAKYTDPGGRISISVSREGSDVVITVQDNGIGITSDLLPVVFEPFVQAPQPSARSVGGMGIGLSLVRSFVERHGGSVSAASAGPRKGSVLTVRLPMLESATAAAAHPPTPALDSPRVTAQPKRVLIVDDNEDARVSAADLLSLLGHEVKTAATGLSALEVVEEFTPDVAFLDIGLPGMDGYELARRLRAKFGSALPLRLIALTGYGQESDRAQTRAAGFDAHLVKPVELTNLLSGLVNEPPGPS
ncbi:MAG TPA: PAS domain S-box protein [Polyangia bacterium]